MRAPSSTPGVIATAIGLVAVGGAAGAATGNAINRESDPLSGAILTIEGAVFGVLVAGFAGIIVAAASKKWRNVGEATALIGVGAPLMLGAVGFAKQALAQSQSAAQMGPASQSSASYTATTANSGQTLDMSVGDVLNVVLPEGMPAPTVSADAVLSVAGQFTTPAPAGGGNNVTYQYLAAAPGNVTLTSSVAATGGAAAATFTLTASVS